jgi:hypothetical protein
MELDFAMLSENYWPSMQNEPFSYHSAIVDRIKDYHNMYAVLKKPRKLHTLHQLGTVELDIEFEDGSLRSFVCNPMQVAVCTVCSLSVYHIDSGV